MSGPPSITDPALLDLMKHSYLTPPPVNPDTTPLDIYEPVWSRLVDWSEMQENLKEIWKDRVSTSLVCLPAKPRKMLKLAPSTTELSMWKR